MLELILARIANTDELATYDLAHRKGKILRWCVFTTRLELILSELPERNQPLRPAAVPQDGTPRGKIAFTISDLRAPPKNSSKRKRQFFRSALF